MAHGKLTMKVDNNVVIFTREFDAPRRLVFEAFSSCEHLVHWWGPKEWPLSSCDMDFREGGSWTYCMKGPEGQLACGKAEYHQIQEPELIDYTDYFLDEEMNVNPNLPSARVINTFTEEVGRTTLVSKTEYPTAQAVKQVLEMGMEAGFAETLDRLDEHLKSL